MTKNFNSSLTVPFSFSSGLVYILDSNSSRISFSSFVTSPDNPFLNSDEIIFLNLKYLKMIAKGTLNVAMTVNTQ